MSDLRSVLFRDGTPTPDDYREAAQELLAAAKQIEESNWIIGCAICEDDHDARQCHHNVLLAARQWVQATSVYVCYHCGFVATNDEEARGHFGLTDDGPPICLTNEDSP